MFPAAMRVEILKTTSMQTGGISVDEWLGNCLLTGVWDHPTLVSPATRIYCAVKEIATKLYLMKE